MKEMIVYDKNKLEHTLDFERFYKNESGIFFSIYRLYESKSSDLWTEIMVSEFENLKEVISFYGYTFERRW